MRVFVTGATGFIGSAVVRELIEAGHQVTGLARNDAAAKSLAGAGAKAHLGGMEDLDSLRRGAAAADGVIHTAFFHGFSQASLSLRLRVMFGGAPTGIVSRFMRAAVDTDRRAIEALGSAVGGSDPAMVVAFPTMALKAGRLATEDDAPDPNAAGGLRGPSEAAALAPASRGIRASVVRLPPSVHDKAKQGIATQLVAVARDKGFSALVGDGRNRWAAVHRLDAARLFRLALENGSPGARYHAVAEEGLPIGQIAEAIGNRFKAPVRAISAQEAAKLFSFFAPFMTVDNPVSSALTQQRLDWRPTEPGLIRELEGLSSGNGETPTTSPGDRRSAPLPQT